MSDKTKAQTITDFNTAKTEPPKALNQGGQASATTSQDSKDIIAQKALDTKEQKRVEKLQADEAAKKAKEEEERNADIVRRAGMQAESANEALNNAVDKPRRFIENLPTPGGIATLVIILLFLTFAAVPVNSNGDTRLKLMWLTLIGKTTLQNNVGTAKNSSGRVVPTVAPVDTPAVLPTPMVPVINAIPLDDTSDILSLLNLSFE